MKNNIKTFEELSLKLKEIIPDTTVQPVVTSINEEGHLNYIYTILMLPTGIIEYNNESYRSNIEGIEDEQNPQKIYDIIKLIENRANDRREKSWKNNKK